jgi:hypothetical protein
MTSAKNTQSAAAAWRREINVKSLHSGVRRVYQLCFVWPNCERRRAVDKPDRGALADRNKMKVFLI